MKKLKDNKKILIDSTFLNKKGKKVKVNDVINENDCWFLRREKKWILTHRAIKTIAQIAGISKNYEVEESPNIVPDYKNDLEHIVRVTIKCNAKGKTKKSCVHSDENTLTVTGEANRISVGNKGKGYLRKMAEKRAYDIAVLEHLDLYSSIFSEEEATKFETKKEPDLLPHTKEFEFIVKEINAILNSKNSVKLLSVSNKIKVGIKINKYSDKQIKYLKELWILESGKKMCKF